MQVKVNTNAATDHQRFWLNQKGSQTRTATRWAECGPRPKLTETPGRRGGTPWPSVCVTRNVTRETDAGSKSDSRVRAEACTARGEPVDGLVDGKPCELFHCQVAPQVETCPTRLGGRNGSRGSIRGAGFPSGFPANTIHTEPHGNIPISLCS